ncbi:Multidrug resistance-associated ABC transporter [Mycena kentingensis (nom. inval.)]|nr:Multidrug resistance-associated ABC transporter [Mycena kentingensis (nom. inval.)]
MQHLFVALFAAVSATSAVALAYSRRTSNAKGTIVLHPVHENFQSAQAGVFDIASSNDFAVGTPLDAAAFWARILGRKIIIILALLLQVAFAHDAVQRAFAVYLLVLAVASFRTRNLSTHARLNQWLAILSSSAVFTLAAHAIVPSGGPVHLSAIVLYLVAATSSLTTPRGPLQHYALTDIYPSSIAESIQETQKTKSNVHGSVDASPLSAIFFSYISRITSLPPGFGVADLPVLVPSLRAAVNFSTIRLAISQFNHWFFPAGIRFGLVTARTNARTLLSMFLIASTIATLRYVRGYCTRNILQLLEQRQRGEDIARWGYVYVAAQLAAGLAFAFGWGQLWNTSHNGELRIVAQTNTLLFMKTLARKQNSAASKGAPQFAHKAEIITVMSQDVHRTALTPQHVYTLTNGTYMWHSEPGFYTVSWASLPSRLVRNQSSLMKAKDERISLTSEILSGIRMIKFMGWERNFEARLWKIRERELTRQRTAYILKTFNLIPVLFALVSFGHYTVIHRQILTPSIAFTAITTFFEIQWAIAELPEIILAAIQCLVSLRRIDQYLDTPEIPISTDSTTTSPRTISTSSASVAWPGADHSAFKLANLTINFPARKLTLVSGKVGAGKSLLLLGLLGEVDILEGIVTCPRSSPDFIATSGKEIHDADWVVPGACAYVPQTAWLRNQSIRDNTVCALLPDLDVFEYGDLTEIGERGIALSGGQRARVSLARAVYSRASVLLLDDILSAVDVHTAHHLYYECLKGPLMHDRTVILVSHYIQLCADGAGHIVALDNGTVAFQGSPSAFRQAAIFRDLVQSKNTQDQPIAETSTLADVRAPKPSWSWTRLAPSAVSMRLFGMFLGAYGQGSYWVLFAVVVAIACIGPVFENTYLRFWSDHDGAFTPIQYLAVYAAIMCFNLGFQMAHFVVLYRGSIHSSRILYKKLLETVLFSDIRFHDTVARGNLLNRFGKDLQIIDESIADDFSRTLKLGLSSLITFVTITLVGGLRFSTVTLVLVLAFAFASQDYGHTSRDMRRLVSTTFSPLYSVFDTAVSGVVVIRSFGASTAFLRDMMRYVDANSCACHWQWGLNRWFSIVSIVFGSSIVTLVGIVVLLTPSIDASLAGMALFFASTISVEAMYFVRAFVGLEQCLVAVERVKETSDKPREAPEFIEPRPPSNWPARGEIHCEDFSVRYAPDLPDVLHKINFHISPGQGIGIVGRTGSGKSSLTLSFFRFIEASSGKLVIDGIDIATLGLTDLRRNLTIIPQDPMLMSGTLRSTLDAFNEHQDADVFDALRRVHLIADLSETVFNNLQSPVAQGGSNFSAGQKQLLCLARPILRHSKVLLIDEATASLDYGTDERIGVTIREKFAESTILTIAHRLRSIIDYDAVMVMEEGRIVEFDSLRALLANDASMFFNMCRATGSAEFATLKSLAGL